MTTPPTIEAVRILELRKATQDLIELLQAHGWLLDDSNNVAEMEACWLGIYNEYVELFEANEGAEARAKLFGRTRFVAGQKINKETQMRQLVPGDRFLNSAGSLCTVLKMRADSFRIDNSNQQLEVRYRDLTVNWTFKDHIKL